MGLPAFFDVIEQTALTRFFDYLPSNPSCGSGKYTDLIRTKSIAAKYPYIQPCPPHIQAWLVFDLDHCDSGIWMDVSLPAPNMIVRDRDSGKSHLYYAIPPVFKGTNARQAPLRYLEAIRYSMALRLDADLRYSGRISKNPLCKDWYVEHIHNTEYSLGELADYFDELITPPRENDHNKAAAEALEPGRNCILFLRLRYWAYRHVAKYRKYSFDRWVNAVDAQSKALNHYSDTPYASQGRLDDKEAATVARSVAKWVWRWYESSRGIMELAELDISTDAKQRLSARRTHEIRSERTEAKIKSAIDSLTQSGKTFTKGDVALLAGISRSQLHRRYAHLFTAPSPTSKPENRPARGVANGVYQITAHRGATVGLASPCKLDEHTKMNENNDLIANNDSRSGGADAKRAFTVICTSLALMEKIVQSDGVTPKFGYKDRARLARLILAQQIPLFDADLLASFVGCSAVETKYSHMTTSDWCGYVIVACRQIKQKIISKEREKVVKFDAFLNGHQVKLSDKDLPDLAEYCRKLGKGEKFT